MPEEDETPRDAVAGAAGDDAQAAALRDAVEEISRVFGRGPDAQADAGNPFAALMSLADPAARERLREAMQTLQGLQGGQVHTSVTTLDLRGTEAGQALRQALLGLGGSGAQVFINSDAPVTVTTSTESFAIDGQATPVEVAPIEVAPTVEPAAWSAASPRASSSQPSIVEEGGGGLFGWLGRLFGGRR